uniref:beta-2-microglobulin-like n=1 Tax=Semicossyphus pulcher TaxID=241346 RepID=UPI0037E7E14D
MKSLICAVLLCVICHTVLSQQSKYVPPKVNVYSRTMGQWGKPNTLLCHVAGFYPPEIKIELLKDGVEIVKANQTDLAFELDWHYHLTKYVPFTPLKGEKFTCKVTHRSKVNSYDWEPDE